MGAFAQTPAGGQFHVNTYFTSFQWDPMIAADPAGGFTAVWASADQDGDGWGVFGQRFDRTGVRRGAEFRVNGYTSFGQFSPDVAADARGNVVVVWGGIGSGGNVGVWGQRFAADGSRRGGEFKVNTGTLTAIVSQQAVASDGAGNFIVVWNNGVADAGVFGQRFASSGEPAGGEFRI